jgi:photosystem II stability/assembly factor-like uncharacterized protein
MRNRTANGLASAVLVWALVGARAAESAISAPVSATVAPAGTAVAWTRIGPGGGGWIQSLAWDPHDGDTLYVGCDVGGFYVSTDAGRHYETRNCGLRNVFIECIAVHPRDRGTILLGTEGGIFRTTDQGRTWQWQRQGFPEVARYACSAPVACIAFDPQAPETLFAGVGRPRWGKDGKGMILRSADGGVTWSDMAVGQLPGDAVVSDLEVKPDDGRVVLAATSQGLFRSADGGTTWTASNQGLPHTAIRELALAPSAPATVYLTLATTSRDQDPWNGGVFVSQDAGLTWEARGTGLPTRVARRGESPYMASTVKEIAVDPGNAEVVYVGNQSWVSAGVWKSTDGGRHWTRASTHHGEGLNMDYGWIREWGPAVECLAICPTRPDRIAFGTSGHLFLTDDAGTTWQQRYCEVFPDGRFAGTGLEVTCAHDAVQDPQRPERLYLCYADIGLLFSEDGGRTFRRSAEGMKHRGNTFTVVVDPEAPQTLWAGTGQWASNQGDVCRFGDGGATWQVVGRPETGLPDGQTRHLVLDVRSPQSARRLLVTSKEHGLFESTDGGASWHDVSGDLPGEVRRQIRGLLLDPADSGHLLLAAGGSVTTGAGLYETRSGGAHWQLLSPGLNVGDIHCLAAAPSDSRHLYLGVRELYDRAVAPPVLRPGGVFASRDGGATWRHLLDYHFVSALAVSPRDSQTVYAGPTDHPYHDDCVAEGVLRSTDGGVSWTHENTGISLPQISFLRISPHDPAVLFAGSGGNSVFIGRERAASTPPP